MSEISEIEIKSMTKEQNYMRGYRDGKSDVLDEIRAEIEEQKEYHCFDDGIEIYRMGLNDAIEIINKYRAGSEEV